jgi:hypothetical protein
LFSSVYFPGLSEYATHHGALSSQNCFLKKG